MVSDFGATHPYPFQMLVPPPPPGGLYSAPDKFGSLRLRMLILRRQNFWNADCLMWDRERRNVRSLSLLWSAPWLARLFENKHGRRQGIWLWVVKRLDAVPLAPRALKKGHSAGRGGGGGHSNTRARLRIFFFSTWKKKVFISFIHVIG